MDVAIIGTWAHAVCLAPSTGVADLSRVIGVDTTGADRVGPQLICASPEGTKDFTFVMDLDTGNQVVFVEFTLVEQIPLEDFRQRFGLGREAIPGPHQVAPTVIFDPVWPPGAQRGCSVLVDLVPGERHANSEVKSVTLYLRLMPPAEA